MPKIPKFSGFVHHGDNKSHVICCTPEKVTWFELSVSREYFSRNFFLYHNLFLAYLCDVLSNSKKYLTFLNISICNIFLCSDIYGKYWIRPLHSR